MAELDALVIGAGFAGMYQLHALRAHGFEAKIVEAGSDVGGVWFWNRYPGARCDIQSVEYSYSFDSALQQEWEWSERYAAQPELLAYARHVADRHGLRDHIEFRTRVTALAWDDTTRRWTAQTDSGRTLSARYVVAATGVLSVPAVPVFAGMDDYAGELLWTSDWPENADLRGRRVGVIGTGSSGLQTITAIAPLVGSLTVFQRTPCYAVPAHNEPLADTLPGVKARYDEIRAASRTTVSGFQCDGVDTALAAPGTDVRRTLDRRWEFGGLCFADGLTDVLVDPRANELAADYVRERIREKVLDPAVAETLLPTYPIAAKRLCVDTGYYEVYNRDTVSLVDLNAEPIVRFTPDGIQAGPREHRFDVVVLATGFDAMTGALKAIDIRNGTTSLRDAWADGPRTYLGLMSAGFPNLFTICGPQSPSVLTNMFTSIEQHVDWITDALVHLRERGLTRIQATPEAQDNWVTTNNDLADLTLMPKAASWYLGSNIPGKQRVFMPFTGGVGLYRQVCDGIATSYYHGFELA
ncbi:flavin-containing monooxygenase [Jatrophihabitans fulvus]